MAALRAFSRVLLTRRFAQTPISSALFVAPTSFITPRLPQARTYSQELSQNAETQPQSRPQRRSPPSVPAELELPAAQRRVLVLANMPFELTEEEIQEQLAEFGQVVSIVPSQDRKGVFFIQFDSPAAVRDALESMSGSLWHGRMIRATRARREITVSSVLFIGNLPFDATDEQLNEIIKPLEDRKAFRWHHNRESGLRNTFAHLEFKNNAAAEKAYVALKGVELSGRFLAVDYAPPVKNRRSANRGPQRESSEQASQEGEKAAEGQPAPAAPSQE